MIHMAMMDLTLTTAEGEEGLKELKSCMKILEILIAFLIKFWFSHRIMEWLFNNCLSKMVLIRMLVLMNTKLLKLKKKPKIKKIIKKRKKRVRLLKFWIPRVILETNKIQRKKKKCLILILNWILEYLNIIKLPK